MGEECNGTFPIFSFTYELLCFKLIFTDIGQAIKEGFPVSISILSEIFYPVFQEIFHAAFFSFIVWKSIVCIGS